LSQYVQQPLANLQAYPKKFGIGFIEISKIFKKHLTSCATYARIVRLYFLARSKDYGQYSKGGVLNAQI